MMKSTANEQHSWQNKLSDGSSRKPKQQVNLIQSNNQKKNQTLKILIKQYRLYTVKKCKILQSYPT